MEKPECRDYVIDDDHDFTRQTGIPVAFRQRMSIDPFDIERVRTTFRTLGEARHRAIELANGKGLINDPDDFEVWDGSSVSVHEDRKPMGE
jgi:hypothetical protein